MMQLVQRAKDALSPFQALATKCGLCAVLSPVANAGLAASGTTIESILRNHGSLELRLLETSINIGALLICKHYLGTRIKNNFSKTSGEANYDSPPDFSLVPSILGTQAKIVIKGCVKNTMNFSFAAGAGAVALSGNWKWAAAALGVISAHEVGRVVVVSQKLKHTLALQAKNSSSAYNAVQ